MKYKCVAFVKIKVPKINPSLKFHTTVEKADIPCMCKLVPGKTEKSIYMDKIVFVTKRCGKTLALGQNKTLYVKSFSPQFMCPFYFIL